MPQKKPELADEEDLRKAVPDYSANNDRDVMLRQARTDLDYATRAYKGKTTRDRMNAKVLKRGRGRKR